MTKQWRQTTYHAACRLILIFTYYVDRDSYLSYRSITFAQHPWVQKSENLQGQHI